MGLKLLARGELDPAGVLVARDGDDLLGALVCCTVPGAGALIWPPQTQTPGLPGIEDQLIGRALHWLSCRGARLVQALLFPSETPLAPPLERNGLGHITSLWYLRHDLTLAADLLRAESRLVYQAYRHGDRALFHDTLLRSYEGTLDCPEVNGVRSLEEILEAHRAQGIYHPEQWWLAREGSEPVGVLILSEMPEQAAWDVSYIGIVPEGRGRGLGQALLARAILEARTVETSQLTLAVDARNQPARNLYRRVGFEPCEAREVYLKVLPAGRV
jgi:ribosomal protein S18 acetylase RimI-like enzyme